MAQSFCTLRGLIRCWRNELGHLHHVMELMKRIERRNPAELLPPTLPEPIEYKSQRHYVRRVLAEQVHLRANGKEIVEPDQESKASIAYRKTVNAQGSPSEIVAAGYVWTPGTELSKKNGKNSLEAVPS
jgi:hypothetical protein